MKKFILQVISIIIISIGLVLMVKAYTDAPGTPPACPSGYPGCDAPLNVGPTDQTKNAGLTLNDNDDALLTLSRQGATYPTNFRVGTDGALVINNNNSDIITLKNNNVGIGTTGPGANRLAVQTSNDATTNIATFRNTAGTDVAIFDSVSGHGALHLGDSTTMNKVVIRASGDSYFNAGNVGIGTTNPTFGDSHVLHMSGSPRNVIRMDQGSSIWAIGTEDVDNVFRIVNMDGLSLWPRNSTKGIAITPGGNVGIGTAGPTSKLGITAVTGDTSLLNISSAVPTMGTVATISETQAGTGILLQLIGDSDADVGGPFLTTFLKNGNVGIGTASPAQKLHVAGYVRGDSGLCMGGDCRTSWGAVSGLQGGGTVNYISKFTGFGTLGNSQIFDNGSSVGIGTANPGAKLEVSGNIITSSPTASNHAATKGYVDAQVGAAGGSVVPTQISPVYNPNAGVYSGYSAAEWLHANIGCTNLGSGWHLPTIEEVQLFIRDGSWGGANGPWFWTRTLWKNDIMDGGHFILGRLQWSGPATWMVNESHWYAFYNYFCVK